MKTANLKGTLNDALIAVFRPSFLLGTFSPGNPFRNPGDHLLIDPIEAMVCRRVAGATLVLPPFEGDQLLAGSFEYKA